MNQGLIITNTIMVMGQCYWAQRDRDTGEKRGNVQDEKHTLM